MNRRCALAAEGSGSRINDTSPSRKNAMPQPSICGPVAPPRRANSANEICTVVGSRLEIPNNSHMLRVDNKKAGWFESSRISITCGFLPYFIDSFAFMRSSCSGASRCDRERAVEKVRREKNTTRHMTGDALKNCAARRRRRLLIRLMLLLELLSEPELL